jgi:hypothetical protein
MDIFAVLDNGTLYHLKDEDTIMLMTHVSEGVSLNEIGFDVLYDIIDVQIGTECYFLSSNGELWRYSYEEPFKWEYNEDEGVWEIIYYYPDMQRQLHTFEMIAENVKAFTTSYESFLMYIDRDNALWVQGVNSHGQLGIGSDILYGNTPIKLMDDVVDIVTSGFSSAAITSDGSLYVWGVNLFGDIFDVEHPLLFLTEELIQFPTKIYQFHTADEQNQFFDITHAEPKLHEETAPKPERTPSPKRVLEEDEFEDLFALVSAYMENGDYIKAAEVFDEIDISHFEEDMLAFVYEAFYQSTIQYLNGDEAEQDKDEAAYWFDRAAEINAAAAQANPEVQDAIALGALPDIDNINWVAMRAMPGRSVSERNVLLAENSYDKVLIDRDNTEYRDWFTVGYIMIDTPSYRWRSSLEGSMTYTVNISEYDVFRALIGTGSRSSIEVSGPPIGTGGRLALYGDLKIFIDNELVLEKSFIQEDANVPVLLSFPDANEMRIEASGHCLAFIEPYFRKANSGEGGNDSSTALVKRTIVFPDHDIERHVDVLWSDELFNNPSNEFCHDLALLSVALSSATFNIEGGGNARRGQYIYNAFRTLDFPDDNIRLYSYPGHRKNQDGRNDNPRVPGASDNDLAYAIAYRDIQIDGETVKLIVFAMRGTQTDGDKLVNADIRTAPFGPYFRYTVTNGFRRFAVDVIAGWNNYQTHYDLSGRKIFLFAGYSLGGAAANLLAVDFTSREIAPADDIFAYTFATPNVTPIIGSRRYSNIHNIVNPEDMVVYLPSILWTKFGRIYVIPSIDRWGRDTEIAAFVKEYIELMGGTEQNALEQKGSHYKESYIAWVKSKPL